MERRAGTVKFFRGHWGFCTQDTGGDIFFSHGDVDRTPKAGDRVTYEIVKGPRGDRAVNIRVVEITGENWHEHIGGFADPGRKLDQDRMESQREQVAAVRKGFSHAQR